MEDWWFSTGLFDYLHQEKNKNKKQNNRNNAESEFNAHNP